MKRAWAIAKKDFRQALRNHYFIGIFLLAIVVSFGLRQFLFMPEANLKEDEAILAVRFMVSMAFFTPIGMVGAMTVPLLMVEEKERETLRFLLVSPASISDVLIGKTIVGVVVGMIIGVIAIAIVGELESLLSVMVLLVLLISSALCTGVGLLSSAFFKTALQSNTWSGIPLLVFLGGLLGDAVPPETVMAEALKLLPSHSASALLAASLGTHLPADAMLGHCIYLGIWIAAIYALTLRLYWHD